MVKFRSYLKAWINSRVCQKRTVWTMRLLRLFWNPKTEMYHRKKFQQRWASGKKLKTISVLQYKTNQGETKRPDSDRISKPGLKCHLTKMSNFFLGSLLPRVFFFFMSQISVLNVNLMWAYPTNQRALNLRCQSSHVISYFVSSHWLQSCHTSLVYAHQKPPQISPPQRNSGAK